MSDDDARMATGAVAGILWTSRARWSQELLRAATVNDDGSITLSAGVASQLHHQVDSEFGTAPEGHKATLRADAAKIVTVVRRIIEPARGR